MNNSININFFPTIKQYEALQLLNSKEINELCYGGSISSGKSRLACYWAILQCLKYPGIRGLIGRSQITVLKKTTIKTFLDIVGEWGIQKLINYNQQSNTITFQNGSEIILMDLFQYPSDPDFIKLGSLEISFAIIDEAGEVTEKAYSVLKTRIRYKLKEFDLTPKLLITTNPCKGWLYKKFYVADKEDSIPKNRKFIQALPSDNNYNSKEYIDTLTPENLGEQLHQVLVLGNWEFSSDDFVLFDYTKVLESFINIGKIGNRYISVDVANSGGDKTCIISWIGLQATGIYLFSKLTTQEIVEKVRGLMVVTQTPINNVVVDKVGVGTGVFDLLSGCVGFVANSKPLKDEPFQSLKDQCYYLLAKKMNEGVS